jgi:hypothetical protein
MVCGPVGAILADTGAKQSSGVAFETVKEVSSSSWRTSVAPAGIECRSLLREAA